jgi:hypothetical protein
MCEGFMCDVQWYLHIILILVSCSSLRGMCVETPVLTMGANTLTLSVVLQKCTPRRFLYTKALYVNVYDIRYYV